MKKQSKSRKAKADLGKEVSTLAKQIVAAIKDPVIGNEVKNIGKEALSGLRATGTRIVRTLQNAKESETTQDLKSQARRVLGISQNRTQKTAQHLRQNLAEGLQRVGEELQKLAQNLHKK